MYATKLFANIDALKESGETLPKALFLSPLPQDVLERHEKIIGTVGGYGWTGILLTDKRLYYRLLKDVFWSSVISIPQKGSISMEQVSSLQIGNHDACYGRAYIGHQLLANGKVLGLLRMGGAIEFDEKLIDILRGLFEDENTSYMWDN